MTAMATPRIFSVGARSPLGLSALQVAMCARAQRIEPRSTHFTDHKGHFVGAVRSVCLSDELFGFDRFVALGAPALREAARHRSGRVPLVLALPDRARPDQTSRFDAELCGELAARSGAAVDVAASTIVRGDNAAFGLALEAAVAMLAAGAPLVLAGGLDSYYSGEALAWLDEDRRIFSHHSEQGIVPSEGAAFVLLGRPDLPSGALGPGVPEPPRATLVHLANGREETVASGEPNLGKAMTALVRGAIAAARERISWLVTDVNGERHRVREASLVEARIAEDLAESGRVDALPRELGDVGAATGALHLAVAVTWMRTGAAPARSALFLSSSEGPERSAFVVEGA